MEYVNRAAAYAVLFHGSHRDRIATVRSPRGGYFLPGGGAWAGESPEQTILREIYEELGQEGKLLSRLGEAEQFFFAASDNKHYRMRAVFFLAELIGPLAAPRVSNEEVLCWMPVQEAQEKLFHACHAWAVRQALLHARDSESPNG